MHSSETKSNQANWQEMTPEQKREWRLNNFMNPSGINFVSEEAKKAYLVRAKRLVDVYNLEEPDQVPLDLPVGNLPYIMNGVSERTAMYDYIQAADAVQKFNGKYATELNIYACPDVKPGKLMDLLEYQLYAWPGHGLPINAKGFQYLENEYMKVEEYDDLIRDPSGFWLHTYLPRVFKNFEPFKLFQPLTDMIEIGSLEQLAPLGDPRVQETLLNLIEVGKEYQRMEQSIGCLRTMGIAQGFPSIDLSSTFAKAPFDTLGDTLRGTTSLLKDLYRRPEKVLEACDKIADLTINSILKSSKTLQYLSVFYPLHKGADGWMSQKQFETFYWPSLKKVMNALINEGFIQDLFAEGSFNTRLEYINEFPKGSVTWLFDQTDIFRAKTILGDTCCIQGNVPSSLMMVGTPRDVKAYCRKLIEECGKGGGYVLAAGSKNISPRLENLQAMVESVREYGVYKK
jgi:hypothetical protein